MTYSLGFALDSRSERRAMGICTLLLCVFGNWHGKVLEEEKGKKVETTALRSCAPDQRLPTLPTSWTTGWRPLL